MGKEELEFTYLIFFGLGNRHKRETRNGTGSWAKIDRNLKNVILQEIEM